MKRVQNWQDSDLMDKEVKSCDNKDVGNVKAVDERYMRVWKGSRSALIPKEAIAAFDGDKAYLRATEAEVLAGAYPFKIDEESIEDSREQNNTDRPKVI